jgi:hypothetical protein
MDIGSCMLQVPGFKKLLLLSLISSQIWLTPLMDNCQSTYLRNLKRKTLVIAALVDVKSLIG